MLEINKELQEYVENNILPIYEENDFGHGIKHIEYVIRRSFEFANQFKNIDLNMIYVIAAFHDIAHHIDKDNHEVLSAKLFYEDEFNKHFFTDDQRKIIKEAIEDHRASLEYEPRSDYGKIISSADRNVSLVALLKRTYSYITKHNPDLDLEQVLSYAYEHISEKFGDNGYAKIWLVDPEFDKFKSDVNELLKDKSTFKIKYMEVNGLGNGKQKKLCL